MIRLQFYFLILLILCTNFARCIYVITDFGAIPHEDHRGAHVVNAKAFMTAVLKANAT